MTDQPKQINFTIVPDETADGPRAYANFCAVNHTPFDFTITFCDMAPLSERDVRAAESDHVVRAPVKARIVLSPQVVPNLIAALQEQIRIYTESMRQRPPVRRARSTKRSGKPRCALDMKVPRRDPEDPAQAPGAASRTPTRSWISRIPISCSLRRFSRRNPPTPASIASRLRSSSAIRMRARWRAPATTSSSRSIHATGFFRSKARSLLGMAAALVDDHGGEVPATMEALVALAGRWTQDGKRRAGTCARRSRVSRRPARAARQQSHRHCRNPTIPSRWKRS